MVLMDAPFHINWNITYLCNFNCQHCYSRTTTTQKLSLYDQLKIAQNIVESRVFSVNLGGGEPLLLEDTFSVIEYLAQKHVIVGLSTNGWGINEALAFRLKNLGLSKAFISIDNPNGARHDEFRQKEGSFERAIDAIGHFKKAGIPVYLSTVITRDNYPVLEQVVDLAVETGCVGVDFKRLRLQGNAQNRHDLQLSSEQESGLYSKLLTCRELSWLSILLVYNTLPAEGIDAGCPCGKTSLAIQEDGGIAPCVYSRTSIGNALSDRIDDLWQHSEALATLRESAHCIGGT